MVKITNQQIEFDSNNQTSPYPPIGTILLWGGSNIDDLGSDYLLCNGTVKDVSEYSELFEIIGYTYGSGTQFKVPDFRARFPLGGDDSNLGTKGGVNQLDDAHYPHTHSLTFNEVKKASKRGAETVGFWQSGNNTTTTSVNTSTATIVTPNNESSAQKEYYPKYCIVNYIIRAK